MAAHDADWLAEHDFRDLVAWLDKPDPVPELSGELHDMLLQAFREGVVNGPGGYVDDLISLSAPWGFTLDEVKAPTRVMAGTEDEGIPRRHRRVGQETVGGQRCSRHSSQVANPAGGASTGSLPSSSPGVGMSMVAAHSRSSSSEMCQVVCGDSARR